MKKIQAAAIWITALSSLCFVSCGSPESDGIKAAKNILECDEHHMERLMHQFNDFVNKFDDYNFTTRIEARRKVEEIIDNAEKTYSADLKKAEQQYFEYKDKYQKKRNDAMSFEWAYQQTMNDRIERGLPSQLRINEKILTIIPPKPTTDKIQCDLVGRSFEDNPDGYFAGKVKKIKTDDIREIKILSESEENGMYRLNATILLQERVGSAAFNINMDIIYVLGDADDWTIDGVSANSINIVKTGQYDKYITSQLDKFFNRLILTNYSDVTLIVGGIKYDPYDKSWYKFSVDVSGNRWERISSCADYEIHFVERR